MLGQALHLYTVKDRSRLRMSIRPMTQVSSNEGPVQRRAFSDWALLHSPSLEETGIRGVLLDIGGIALFGGIHSGFCLRHLFAYFGIVTGALVASIGSKRCE